MSWNTTSTTHSISGSLFGLDPDSKSKILVYRYRGGQSNLDQMTQADLCKELDARPDLPYVRVTKKKIPRSDRRLEIQIEDLLPPEDLQKFKDIPLQVNVANVGMGMKEHWQNKLFHTFDTLYIVSRSAKPTPINTANNTGNNSAETSQHVSPATTFPHGGQD